MHLSNELRMFYWNTQRVNQINFNNNNNPFQVDRTIRENIISKQIDIDLFFFVLN